MALAVATYVAYGPALTGDFVWDDDSYILRNETLRSAEGLRRIWFEPGATPQYYPLVFTTFWLEYQLWGARPAGFHVVNVALHVATTVLLGALLRRLNVPGAGWAAAIFALHPVQVESVAWITERKNVLSGMFYMASLAALVRYRAAAGRPLARPDPELRFDSSPAASTAGSRRVLYFLSLLLFGLALTAKTVTATLPAALLLLSWWRRGRLDRRAWLDAAPFFALAVPAGLVTAHLEAELVGATGEAWSLSPLERMLLAGRALWFYLEKLIVPTRLTFVYPRWSIDSGDALSYAYPLAFLGLAGLGAALMRRWGRGPLAGVLYFAGTLFPALGFFDVYPFRYAYVADHFQYLASAGIIVLCSSAAVRLASRATRSIRAAGSALSGALLVVLGLLTWNQAHVYADLETLWRDTVMKNPGAWMAWNNLGFELTRQQRLDEAAEAHHRALAIKPDLHEAHNNLGNIESLRGRREQAEEHYLAAIAMRPEFAEAHYNLGKLKYDQGDLEAARAHFERALQAHPRLARAAYNLGVIAEGLGRMDVAAAYFEQAAQGDPSMAGAWFNLAALMERQGDVAEARRLYERALAADPAFAPAHYNLAILCYETADYAAASRHARAAADAGRPLPPAFLAELSSKR